MNKRDYFAAQAMQAIIAKFPPMVIQNGDVEDEEVYTLIAKGAYEYADAMMYQREEGKY